MNDTQFLRHPIFMRLLLVEDDDDHARIITRTLNSEKIATSVDRVDDGVKAVEYLKHEGVFKDIPLPDLILLDLKLPKKNGLEVLEEIKADLILRCIPVVMLTTSDAESDKIKAYSNFVNSYLVKPIDADQFRKMVSELHLYWGIWNSSPELLPLHH